MEIVVASGKGGTGKTFVSSNLCLYLERVLHEKVVAVDADVEAPDLLMALGSSIKEVDREEFYGSYIPVIDRSKCLKCGKCVKACEFNAIEMGPEGPVIDRSRCEGLGTCAVVCPVKAIRLQEDKTGDIYASETSYGIIVVTGDLELGKGNSGRLVYRLKRKAYEMGSKIGAKFRVVDAAPGIGCPVISSIAGSDILIMVTEPTPQSLKGCLRLMKVAESLEVEQVAIVNMYNLNPGFVEKIKRILKVEILGYIPYDVNVIKAYTLTRPLLEYSPNSKASKALINCFNRLKEGWIE